MRKRCVLLLGQCGAGKSTVANHLVGHDPMSPDEPPFRVSDRVFARMTREIKHETVEFMWENDLCRVTVVDVDSVVYKNALNFNRIVKYIGENKLRIDRIIFVMKKGRLTEEERALFPVIMAKFRQNRSSLTVAVRCPKEVSALVVTGCEQDTTTAREELVQELKVDPTTREIASQMGMGIYPVGFPPVERMIPVLRQVYIPRMVQDRDMLRELIVRRVNIRGEQHCF